MSLLFKKIIVLKPNSGNIYLSERYIVCKNFQIPKSTRCVVLHYEYVYQQDDTPSQCFLNSILIHA